MKFYILGEVDLYGMVDLVRLFYGSCRQGRVDEYAFLDTTFLDGGASCAFDRNVDPDCVEHSRDCFWVLDGRDNDFRIWELSRTWEEKAVTSAFSRETLNKGRLFAQRKDSIRFLEGILSENEFTRFFQVKRDNKRLFYSALANDTGVSFPWGSLTGIRPTLIAHELIEILGRTERVNQVLTDYYLLRPAKAKLVVQTALEETRILNTLPTDSVGVYISIPFCPSKCTYCSFSTPEGIGRSTNEIEDYLTCLKLEIDAFAPHIKQPVSVLYVGGGTPGTLSAEQVLDLGRTVKETLPLLPDCEMTFEAGRPDQIDLPFLQAVKAAGFKKICINPQTFHDETLVRVGRQHEVSQTIAAYELARKVGFEAINMDLILGLPDEDVGQMQTSLERLLELVPDSFTIHSLAVKKASKLRAADYAREQKDHFRQENLSLEEIHLKAAETAREIGLVPYYMYRQKDAIGGLENLGFARPLAGNKYNLAMMGDGLTIYGFGAGSMSKRISGSLISRAANVKSIHEYKLRWAEMVERKLVLETVKGE